VSDNNESDSKLVNDTMNLWDIRWSMWRIGER